MRHDLMSPSPLIIVPASLSAAGPSRGLRIALVMTGMLLFLGVGAALLLWILKDPANLETKNMATTPATDDVDEIVKTSVPGKPMPTPAPVLKGAAVNGALIQLTAEEDKTIDDMVFRGVTFLKMQQGPEGTWGQVEQPEWQENLVGFCGLTLLECGVKADDPVIQKAAKYARDLCPRIERTYVIAMLVLFLDRLNDPQDKDAP